jgi:hypothetical protein
MEAPAHLARTRCAGGLWEVGGSQPDGRGTAPV